MISDTCAYSKHQQPDKHSESAIASITPTIAAEVMPFRYQEDKNARNAPTDQPALAR
jgi:hypothetical protein